MSKRKADVLAAGTGAQSLWSSVAILIHVILCGWSLRRGRRHRRQCSECVCVVAAFHRSGDRTHLRMHCQSEQRHRRRLHPHTLKHIRVATQLVGCSLPVAAALLGELLQEGELRVLGLAGLLHCQSLWSGSAAQIHSHEGPIPRRRPNRIEIRPTDWQGTANPTLCPNPGTRPSVLCASIRKSVRNHSSFVSAVCRQEQVSGKAASRVQ